MGLTHAGVELVNPNDQSRRLQADLLVDTGSVLTWVKSARLEQIGVRPRRKKEFKTIEGRLISRNTGPVVICFDGVEADAEVVFAEESDSEVLGVTALEGLGYQVDPVTQELRRSSLLAI